MRIRLLSDIHLEFYTTPVKLWRYLIKRWQFGDFPLKSEVLILAGDIGYPFNNKLEPNANYKDFLVMVRKVWNNVILVSGNHEYYSGKGTLGPEEVDKEIRRVCNEIGVHFLQKDSITIEGTRYLGCTLWTDINQSAFDSMNDKNIFENDITKYQAVHQDHRRWLEQEIPKEIIPTVVITHHLPSFQIVHPRFQAMTAFNTGFASDLDELIIANPQVKMWCCGHTHERNVQVVGTTPIVCNPYGYPGEKRVTKVNWDLEDC